MEAFLVLALALSAASHEAALAQARAAHPYYYAQEQAVPPVTYAPVVHPAPVFGAMAGALVAAEAGAPLLFGAAAGGLIGHAIATPPVHQAYAEPAPRRSAASSQGFIERWQSFMEPATAR